MKAFNKLKKKNVPFETILGLTFNAIEVQDDQIDFATNTGRHFIMYHQRDCCEEVYVESVVGDVSDLLDSPILIAEMSTNCDNPKDKDDKSHTWTFYKIATIKGYVDLRWYGNSNGYYSEEVDFCEYVIEEEEW